MKKYLFPVIVFLFIWFFMLSAVMVSYVLWSYFFYNTREVVITPNRFIAPAIIGLVAAIYYSLSGKKKTE
jgi:CDP-diglyceride synthetase